MIFIERCDQKDNKLKNPPTYKPLYSVAQKGYNRYVLAASIVKGIVQIDNSRSRRADLSRVSPTPFGDVSLLPFTMTASSTSIYHCRSPSRWSRLGIVGILDRVLQVSIVAEDTASATLRIRDRRTPMARWVFPTPILPVKRRPQPLVSTGNFLQTVETCIGLAAGLRPRLQAVSRIRRTQACSARSVRNSHGYQPFLGNLGCFDSQCSSWRTLSASGSGSSTHRAWCLRR